MHYDSVNLSPVLFSASFIRENSFAPCSLFRDDLSHALTDVPGILESQRMRVTAVRGDQARCFRFSRRRKKNPRRDKKKGEKWKKIEKNIECSSALQYFSLVLEKYRDEKPDVREALFPRK